MEKRADWIKEIYVDQAESTNRCDRFKSVRWHQSDTI